MDYKTHMEKRIERNVKFYVTKGVKVLVFALFIIGLFTLACYILMRLWNWLMPDIFGLATLTFWQAVGIMIIAKLIFGFGGGGSSSKRSNRSNKWKERKTRYCGPLKQNANDWKQYEQFWKEEGEAAFQAYVERRKTTDEKEENEKGE